MRVLNPAPRSVRGVDPPRASRVASLALALSLAGCSLFTQAVRTVHDLAVLACELYASEHEAELAGVSPADFCAVNDNLAPFVDAIGQAQATAGAEVGLGKQAE